MTVQTDEILSEEEIVARYPDQWVLVDLLEWDEQLRITRGVVRAHGTDRTAIHQAARMLPIPRKISIFWTGEIKGNFLLNHGLFL